MRVTWRVVGRATTLRRGRRVLSPRRRWSPSRATHPVAAPAPNAIHIVKEGETLSEIAATHGITLRELREANAETLGGSRKDIKGAGGKVLRGSDIIFVGQQLEVPSKPDVQTVANVSETSTSDVPPPSSPSLGTIATGAGALLAVVCVGRFIQQRLSAPPDVQVGNAIEPANAMDGAAGAAGVGENNKMSQKEVKEMKKAEDGQHELEGELKDAAQGAEGVAEEVAEIARDVPKEDLEGVKQTIESSSDEVADDKEESKGKEELKSAMAGKEAALTAAEGETPSGSAENGKDKGGVGLGSALSSALSRSKDAVSSISLFKEKEIAAEVPPDVKEKAEVQDGKLDDGDFKKQEGNSFETTAITKGGTDVNKEKGVAADEQLPGPPDPAVVVSNGAVPLEVVQAMRTAEREPIGEDLGAIDIESAKGMQGNRGTPLKETMGEIKDVDREPLKKEVEGVQDVIAPTNIGPTDSISPEDAVWAAALASTTVDMNDSLDAVSTNLVKLDQLDLMRANQETQLSMEDMLWAADLTKKFNSTDEHIVEVASLRATAKAASRELEAVLWSAAAAAASGENSTEDSKRELDARVRQARERMMGAIVAMERAIMSAGVKAVEESTSAQIDLHAVGTPIIAEAIGDAVKTSREGAEGIEYSVGNRDVALGEPSKLASDDLGQSVEGAVKVAEDRFGMIGDAVADNVGQVIEGGATAVKEKAVEVGEVVEGAISGSGFEKGVGQGVERAREVAEEVATAVEGAIPEEEIKDAKDSEQGAEEATGKEAAEGNQIVGATAEGRIERIDQVAEHAEKVADEVEKVTGAMPEEKEKNVMQVLEGAEETMAKEAVELGQEAEASLRKEKDFGKEEVGEMEMGKEQAAEVGTAREACEDRAEDIASDIGEEIDGTKTADERARNQDGVAGGGAAVGVWPPRAWAVRNTEKASESQRVENMVKDTVGAPKYVESPMPVSEMSVGERQEKLQEKLDHLIKALETPKYLPAQTSEPLKLPEGEKLTGSAFVQAHTWAAQARKQVHVSASSLGDDAPEGPVEGPPAAKRNGDGGNTMAAKSNGTTQRETRSEPSCYATKISLLDAVYGVGRGLDTSMESRATVEELLTMLESTNAAALSPSKAMQLLDGRWKLVYTTNAQALAVLHAFRSMPLVNVGDITQIVDGANLTVENKVEVAVPFMMSLSAHAGFEVRTPRQLKVQFHRGKVDTRITTPQLFAELEVPSEVSVLGQKVDLRRVQQLMSPVNSALKTASRTVASVVAPELEFEVPSYLLITYLDSNLRVSRDANGGVFVMVKDIAIE